MTGGGLPSGLSRSAGAAPSTDTVCLFVRGLMRADSLIAGFVAVLAVAQAGCATAGRATAAPQTPSIVQPGAPGQPTRAITVDQATAVARVQHTPADVRFVHDMLAHHAQALEMTALRADRSSSEDLRLMALRIELSQQDEIRMMQDWLTRRGEPLPDPHAHHHGTAMPGMLTAEEMARLADARGGEFDRLFLELMIKHHQGALVMVDALFATAGAGQESELFAFASDIVDDQRIEIDRMAAMLKERQQ